MVRAINISILILLFIFNFYTNKLVSGVVLDCKTNLPIPGAQVAINKQQLNKNNVLTNFDGYFELEVSKSNKEIFITYPKYKEMKINIEDNHTLGNIILFKRGCKKSR